jgi:hypothetical protein
VVISRANLRVAVSFIMMALRQGYRVLRLAVYIYQIRKEMNRLS